MSPVLPTTYAQAFTSYAMATVQAVRLRSDDDHQHLPFPHQKIIFVFVRSTFGLRATSSVAIDVLTKRLTKIDVRIHAAIDSLDVNLNVNLRPLGIQRVTLDTSRILVFVNLTFPFPSPFIRLFIIKKQKKCSSYIFFCTFAPQNPKIGNEPRQSTASNGLQSCFILRSAVAFSFASAFLF